MIRTGTGKIRERKEEIIEWKGDEDGKGGGGGKSSNEKE